MPHLSPLLLVAASALATVAGPAQESELAGPQRREVAAVLRELQRANASWRSGPFDELWDLDRMIDEIREVMGEGLAEFDGSDVMRRAFSGGLRKGMRELKAEFKGAEFELLRVEPGASEREATALARVREQDGNVYRARFWLAKGENGWKLWDFAEASVRLRYSTILGSTLAALYASEGGADRIQGILLVVRGLEALPEGDLETCNAILGELEGYELPASIDRLRITMRASARIQEQRYEEALAVLRAMEGSWDPVHDFLGAVALNRTGEPEAALAHARAFLEALAGDADGHREAGLALFALARVDEALAAFGLGLDEAPDDPDLLFELAARLPLERLSELEDRFLAASAPRSLFEPVVIALLGAGEVEAAEVLVATLRELAPEDTNADYYGAELLAARGDHAAAAAALLAALPRVTDEDERGAFQQSYALQMIHAGAELEAYGSLGEDAAAFELVAEALIGEETGGRLLGFVELRAAQAPEDPWLEYYRGIALAELGRRDEAEAAFVLALEVVPAELREYVTGWRTENLVEAGRWREAYEAGGGTDELTDRLATLLSHRGAADDLEALVELHAANVTADPLAAQLAWWRAEVLWLRAQYAPLLEHLAAERDAIVASDPLGWEDRVVRSNLRLERFEAARELAVAIDARDADPFYLGLVTAGAGSPDEARSVMVRIRGAGYALEDLDADPDFGPLLAQPRHADLRAVFGEAP